MSVQEHTSRRALQALLKQPATYGSVAFIGLCDVFPAEWLEWEPKTVQLEIRDTFGISIESDLFDKIMAARQVVVTDFAFRELPIFITIVNALNGDGVDTPVSQPIDPADLGWGVLEMCLLYPPSPSETFSEEIIGYMEECLRWQGVRGVPNSLVNILPPSKYDDVQAADPMIMEGFFQRLQDINDEITANLNAWKYQMKQLKPANGKIDWVDEHIKTADMVVKIHEITVTTSKGPTILDGVIGDDDGNPFSWLNDTGERMCFGLAKKEQPRDEEGRFVKEDDDETKEDSDK